jgi:hypothetical protein
MSEKRSFQFPDEVEQELEVEPEVEIVDDTPPDDRGRKPADEPPKEFSDDELETYNDSVKKRIKHFTKGYHDERRAKEAAFREREEALKLAQSVVEENNKLKGSLNQGQTVLLEQARKVVENELQAAKNKYKSAYELGDSEALADAQSELTAVTIKARELHNFKPAPLQEERNQVQTQVTQPVIDRKAEVWKEKNPWFGSDRRMTSYALAIHEELTQDERLNPSSEEYYRRIDSEMRTRFPDAFETTTIVDATPPPSKKSVVAPATRSTASTKIVLNQSQVNIAKRLGLPLEVYARQVLKDRKGA